MALKNSFKLIILSTFFFFSFSNLYAVERGKYATQNLVGQDYYLAQCSSCHGEGNRGGNMASIREWLQIFAQNGQELVSLHEDDKESIHVMEYLKSKQFKKESEEMRKFLQEFAYDSDNIPTCN